MTGEKGRVGSAGSLKITYISNLLRIFFGGRREKDDGRGNEKGKTYGNIQ